MVVQYTLIIVNIVIMVIIIIVVVVIINENNTQVRSHRSLAPIPTPNLAKERVGVAGTSPRTPFEP